MSLPPRKNPFEPNFRVYNSGWNDALDAVEQAGTVNSPLVKALVAEIDELKQRLAKAPKPPRAKIKPVMIALGARRDGATVIDYEGGLHVVRCACGNKVLKSLYSLSKPAPWRCEACRVKARQAQL